MGRVCASRNHRHGTAAKAPTWISQHTAYLSMQWSKQNLQPMQQQQMTIICTFSQSISEDGTSSRLTVPSLIDNVFKNHDLGFWSRRLLLLFLLPFSTSGFITTPYWSYYRLIKKPGYAPNLTPQRRRKQKRQYEKSHFQFWFGLGFNKWSWTCFERSMSVCVKE